MNNDEQTLRTRFHILFSRYESAYAANDKPLQNEIIAEIYTVAKDNPAFVQSVRGFSRTLAEKAQVALARKDLTDATKAAVKAYLAVANPDVANVGGRRRRNTKKARKTHRKAGSRKPKSSHRRKSRRATRGGMLSEAQLRAGQLNPSLVQQAPRTGYTFDGSGVAGTPDPVRY